VIRDKKNGEWKRNGKGKGEKIRRKEKE